MAKIIKDVSRRGLLKTGAKGGAAIAAGLAAPSFFTRHAFGQEFRNNPGDGASVVFGFNVPQTGAYADEGADELRAYELAVEHLNGEGDGGMINTMSPKALRATASSARRSTSSPATRRPSPMPPAPPPSA